MVATKHKNPEKGPWILKAKETSFKIPWRLVNASEAKRRTGLQTWRNGPIILCRTCALMPKTGTSGGPPYYIYPCDTPPPQQPVAVKGWLSDLHAHKIKNLSSLILQKIGQMSFDRCTKDDVKHMSEKWNNITWKNFVFMSYPHELKHKVINTIISPKMWSCVQTK